MNVIYGATLEICVASKASEVPGGKANRTFWSRIDTDGKKQYSSFLFIHSLIYSVSLLIFYYVLGSEIEIKHRKSHETNFSLFMWERYIKQKIEYHVIKRGV